MAPVQPTHYDVLGISRDADAVEIRAAWKLHVQVWHPDRFDGDTRAEAEQRTARINEAYTTLRDSSRRAAYDCRLAADERDTEREERARPVRRTVDPRHARPASAPIGEPVLVAHRPATIAEHLAAAADEGLRAMRRRPRITAAAVAACTLLLGGSAVLYAATGPSLPAGASSLEAAPARHVVDVAEREAETEGLAALAEQARIDAEQAEAEMAELLRQDQADAAAADAEAARIAAAQAAAARTAPRPANGAAAGATSASGASPPPGGRIVRVMPRQ